MVGLVLALLWGAWGYFHGAELTAIYHPAVTFMYHWYVVWAIIAGLFYLILIILMSLGVGAHGFDSLGFVGGVIGLIGGGLFGILALGIKYVMQYGCLIFGTLLLNGALVENTWDNTRLIFGCVLLVVGLLASRSSSSSSSSSSSK